MPPVVLDAEAQEETINGKSLASGVLVCPCC